MTYFVGVDGGGSATRAVVLDESRNVVGRGTAGPSNHYVAGAAEAAKNCRAAVTAACDDTRRIVPTFNEAQVVSWGLGLAGVRRGDDHKKMRGALGALLTGTPFVLDTDVAAAHSGAFGGGPGVVLCAGTGAIALACADSEKFYADGWGPLLGDEGGGYWMGLAALRAVCRAADGRAPRTRLTSLVFDALSLVNLEQLVPLIQSLQTSREQIAALARHVFDAAEGGDAAALEIRQSAVEKLADTAAAAARQLLQKRRERAGVYSPEPLELQIALCGGLFDDDTFRASAGYQIGERFVAMKRDYLPVSTWRVIRPQHDAAVGAALWAT